MRQTNPGRNWQHCSPRWNPRCGNCVRWRSRFEVEQRMKEQGRSYRRQGKRSFLILLLLWASLFLRRDASWAGDLSAEFDRANKLYEERKYSEAVAAYAGLVNAGRVSTALYFNLANALYKAGQSGRALAWYRRAEALAPRDPDVQANLQFLRKNLTGGTPSLLWRQRLQKLSLNEWTVLTMAAVWLWFGMLTLREWQPQFRIALRGYTAMAGVTSALLAVCLGIVLFDRYRLTPAVVVVSEAVVRRGPLEE